ncbi:MAG: PKD domain-containing protein [Planctomycetes bacterium]|nr:PKD domain-containing protein [Planctomycetota bacterium]
MIKSVPALVLGLLCLAAVVPAQTADLQSIEAAVWHDSGTHQNAQSLETMKVHEHQIHHPGAASLRILFAEVSLGANDWIEARGMLDGETHRLDLAELAKWEMTSAYFNGDTVTLSLHLAPGSTGSFETAGYFWGPGGTGSAAVFGSDTICGNVDDRIPSTDNRSGRFVASPTSSGGGCTIWLCSADSCAASAGHCFSGGSLMVAEFNLPLSTASGALQHPPVADQFTVDASTISFTDGGVGNDWGICKLNANNLGQTAANRFGHFTLGFFTPSPTDTIRITGCGTDDNTANQTLQTHTGPLTTVSGFQLSYMVDTTGGNSGSPVIDETSGNAIGIHTHGGCTASGGANSGTSVTHSAFVTAVGNLCNLTATQPPVASFSQSATSISQGQSVTFSSTSSNFPSIFAWDLNGDGLTDATSSNPTFSYTTPGNYTVSLTVSNAIGSDTLTVPNAVTVTAITPASLPYTQDFNAGLPTGGEWSFSSETGGRILATIDGDPSPGSGGNALVMDCTTSGASATNNSVLFLNLASASSVLMTYRWRETLDEDDPEDGVFLSDGTNEVLAFSHNGGPQTWTTQTIDIAAVAAANGLSLNATFQVIFRQRDNFPLGTDGVLIDDVNVAAPVGSGGQANSVGASLIIPGSVDFNGFPVAANGVGPYVFSAVPGTAFNLEVSGDANQAIILLSGPLNIANANFSIGQLDLGLLGQNNLSDITVSLNGVMPQNFLDLTANTGSTGSLVYNLTLPPFPPGPLASLQAAVYRAGTGLPVFTAATQIIVQ